MVILKCSVSMGRILKPKAGFLSKIILLLLFFELTGFLLCQYDCTIQFNICKFKNFDKTKV